MRDALAPLAILGGITRGRLCDVRRDDQTSKLVCLGVRFGLREGGQLVRCLGELALLGENLRLLEMGLFGVSTWSRAASSCDTHLHKAWVQLQDGVKVFESSRMATKREVRRGALVVVDIRSWVGVCNLVSSNRLARVCLRSLTNRLAISARGVRVRALGKQPVAVRSGLLGCTALGEGLDRQKDGNGERKERTDPHGGVG